MTQNIHSKRFNQPVISSRFDAAIGMLCGYCLKGNNDEWYEAPGAGGEVGLKRK